MFEVLFVDRVIKVWVCIVDCVFDVVVGIFGIVVEIVNFKGEFLVGLCCKVKF